MNIRTVIIWLFLTSIPSVALAHPGVGIVMDSRGIVFYTDLKHVWKVDTYGKKSVAVRNIHTHELYIDAQDNLYGEHLWYEGEATDRWKHYVWRLSPEGNLTTIIPSRVGFRDDYDDFHFVRDETEALYWVDRGQPTAVRKRTAQGELLTLATAAFQNVRWMTATRDGTVYLVDLHNLVRVSSDGQVKTVVKNLAERRRSFLLSTDTHAIMGLWTDRLGNVYAAVMSDGAVKKIDPNGRVEVVARSSLGWAPTGGLVAPDGSLWILEYAALQARARRIDTNGKSTVY